MGKSIKEKIQEATGTKEIKTGEKSDESQKLAALKNKVKEKDKELEKEKEENEEKEAKIAKLAKELEKEREKDKEKSEGKVAELKNKIEKEKEGKAEELEELKSQVSWFTRGIDKLIKAYSHRNREGDEEVVRNLRHLTLEARERKLEALED